MANDPLAQPSQQATERWEYFVHTYEKLSDMQADLDQAGQNGWEAVNVAANTVPRSSGGAVTFQVPLWTLLMKRRLP